jgi:lysine 6-dehydrogenase
VELAHEFEDAGLLALLGIGSSPGKTNLMAVRAVHELRQAGGGEPRAIEVCAAGRDPLAREGEFTPPYAVQTLIDELTLAPVVLRDGRAVEIEPLRDGGAVDFGEPVEAADTIYTLHSELATFGESFGCREASFRLSLAPALLERLRALVGAPPEAIKRAAREAVAPSAETVSVHLVTATGSGQADDPSAERRVTVRAITRPHFGLGGSIVSTAAPAAAAVRLLARGQLTATGMYPPERCVDPGLMFAELETRGCSFTVTTSVPEAAGARPFARNT